MLSACPNCGSERSRFAFKTKDYEHGVPGEWMIDECEDCGLFYQSPLPIAGVIPSFYPPSYSAYNGDSPIRWLLDLVYWLDALRVRRLIGERGRILDIGCGDGSALARLRSHGAWDLHGVEFDDAAANKARERRLDVRVGDVVSAGFTENSFDLVRMGHVIEHVLDPIATTDHVFKLLKPGGYLIGETPNTNCADFRLFRNYWGALHVPRHLTFFNVSNLTCLLRDRGFSQIQMRPRLRTVGWSCGIQNILADRVGLRVPPCGRVGWYILLILPFLPFTMLQAIFGRTATVAFVARKP